MSAFYEAVGRAVVGYVRRRYAREIRFAAGTGAVALAGLAVGAYLATRDDQQ
jgi:hypothetical protein